MFLKRTSPNLALPLAGSGLRFGEQIPFHGAIVPTETITNQVKPCELNDPYGNRCEHNKHKPRVFQEPTQHKKRPYLIVEARKRLRRTYYNPYTFGAGKMAFHIDKSNKDGSKRKVRSEKRETITHLVGEATLHYVNIEAMAVGFKDIKTNKFINIGITQIADKAGVSYQRARTALRVFEEAGVITIEQSAYVTKSGKCRKSIAFIRLTKQFFYNLGFDDQDIINYKSKEQAEYQKKILEQKRLNFKHKERLHQKIKKGEKLETKEMNNLDKEKPGWRQSYQKRPEYVDYTGTARRSTDIDRDIAKKAIAAIRAKLNTS